MKTAVVVLASLGALLVQTTLSGLFVGATLAVNLVLVAVVYVALAFGPVTGMLRNDWCSGAGRWPVGLSSAG